MAVLLTVQQPIVTKDFAFFETIVVLAGVVGYLMIRWAEAPVLSEADHPPEKIVVIPEGATFNQAATPLIKNAHMCSCDLTERQRRYK